MFSLPLLLLACGEPPVIEGRVLDVWGDPIEGATVMVVGGTERPLTDASGRYKLARAEGKFTVKAGRKGFIQDQLEFEVLPGQEPGPGPLFQLYPKPEKPGFYAITPGKYLPLDEKVVLSVGNTLRAFRGVQSLGGAEVEVENPRILFHTELRTDEILRLGLELHRLEYVDHAELQGPMGSTDVGVKLYVDSVEIPIDIVPLRSKTDYLVVPKEKLEPGGYAFQTQELLSPSETDRFDEIPDELRVVYALSVR
jgi:hypothetical protein